MSDVKTTNWKVRPGYAFAGGAGIGGGIFVFEFLNEDEGLSYGMLLGGVGLAGGILGGKWSTIGEAIKKLATNAGLKLAPALYGAATDSTPGFKNQAWSSLPCKKAFSSSDFHNSTGRVTIAGLSVARVGYYGCFISASDGIVSSTPLFESVRVDVQPQKFDLQMGVILGLWREQYSVPLPI